MGRKGIGKLLPFFIADIVTVQSVRDGERHGFTMRVRDMVDSASRGEPYRPESIRAIPDLEAWIRITLSGLKPSSVAPRLRSGSLAGSAIMGKTHYSRSPSTGMVNYMTVNILLLDFTCSVKKHRQFFYNL